MNPTFFVSTFAWISIIALTCSIFTSYWLPILFGSVLGIALMRIVLPSR